MRNAKPWAAFAVAVPLLLMTATSSFSSPQDKAAPTEVQAQAAADSAPAASDDSQKDVSVTLQLEDDSSATEGPDTVEPTPPEKPEGNAPAPDPGILAKIKDVACRFVGTPYRWGGTTPAAFDCSGFTRYVYNTMGICIPRTAREQFKAGKPVKREELKTGDLIFFDMSKGYVSHVGLYLGDGVFIHASTPATGVKIDNLNERTYKRCFVGARRFHCV